MTTGTDVTDQNIIDQMQREIDSLEAKLEAVGRLPEKWEEDTMYMNSHEQSVQDGKTYCANELQSILETGK